MPLCVGKQNSETLNIRQELDENIIKTSQSPVSQGHSVEMPSSEKEQDRKSNATH